MLLVAIVNQRVEAFHGFDPDIAATAAIATIRPAEFDISFPSEGDATVASVSGLYVNFTLVEKFHRAAQFGSRDIYM